MTNMSANDGTSSSLVAELSFSFQDELTATIQNALGVAVEIAVVEITKLVSQVLRGVRDQMHETLRDNKSLKFRLQAAELELSTVQDRLEEHRHTGGGSKGDVISCSIGIQQVHDQLTSLSTGREQTTVNIRTQDCESNGELLSNQRVDGPSDVKEMFGILDDPPETNPYSAETFCEIREDGRVCTQDIKHDVSEEPQLQHESQERPVTKEEQSGLRSCIQEKTSHFNDECLAPAHSVAQALSDGQSKLSEAEVKVEASALNCSSNTDAYGARGDEDFGADSLSLAQSQLLEDWRPDPLQLQSCDSDTFTPSTSHSLADSPIFSADIPDLALLPPAGSGHSVPFSKPYQHRNPLAPPTSSSAQNQPYPSHSRNNHVCKVCGQTFRLSEELRRHRKNHIRSPKKSLFPPGRSPYHCSLCGRDFNRMEHLKIHQRIHTGERPYGCTVCNARFRHSWALTRHFRIHTGEKPYTCGICGKTFRNCGGLRFHQRSHGVGAVGGVS